MSSLPRDSHSSTPTSSPPPSQSESDTARIISPNTESTSASAPASAPAPAPALASTSSSTKTNKRRLFGLGKKKDKQMDQPGDAPMTASTQSAIANMRPLSSSPSPPNRAVAVSPVRPFGSPSPQPSASLASSQIFERNVQESVVPSELSPAIPSHIQTEDHIPPVLEASSLAITDDHLDPDHVEIVTHTAHQPAAEKVAEGAASALHSDTQLPLSPQDSQHESFYSAGSHQLETDETTSNYGALDPNDVHRLSFISFADVVQAEQAESSSRDSLHHMSQLSATSLSQARTQSPPLARSPSPTRSPLSSQHSHEVTTPPHIGSNPTSIKGLDMSPGRSPLGSPHQQHGELTIETMRQALRKTGSGDFSSAKIGSLPGSHPTSAVGGDDGTTDKNPFK